MSYDDIEIDEAIDLIHALPWGSLFMAKKSPHYAWNDTQNVLADIHDAIWALVWMNSTEATTKGAPRIVRPWEIDERKRAKEKSKQAKYVLENTVWEEIKDG